MCTLQNMTITIAADKNGTCPNAAKSIRWLYPLKRNPINTWFRWHRVRKTPLVIMENVKQCPLWFVMAGFGYGWTITTINVTPEDVNFDLVGRSRTYFIITCNETCHRLADIEARFYFYLKVKLQQMNTTNIHYKRNVHHPGQSGGFWGPFLVHRNFNLLQILKVKDFTIRWDRKLETRGL